MYKEGGAQASAAPFPADAILRGKWHGQTYRLLRVAGRGANGVVYLGWRGRQRVAVKTSERPGELALEYERLRWVAEEFGDERIGPRVYELDDVTLHGRMHSVLVMEWVEGVRIDRFVGERGCDWVPLCMMRIIRLLTCVDGAGYAFCDVKPANILVHPDTAEVRLVDFGGVTRHGRAVKEFTESCDRAWWGLGGRRAEGSYDVASCGLLGVQLLEPIPPRDLERLASKTPAERREYLRGLVRRAGQRSGSARVFEKAFAGEFADLDAFRSALGEWMQKSLGRGPNASSGPFRARTARRRRWDATDYGLLASVALFAGALLAVIWLGRL